VPSEADAVASSSRLAERKIAHPRPPSKDGAHAGRRTETSGRLVRSGAVPSVLDWVVRPEGIEPPTFGFVVGGRLTAGPLVFCTLARNHAIYLSILSWVVCDTDVLSRQART
jgi:hypothetical protein